MGKNDGTPLRKRTKVVAKAEIPGRRPGTESVPEGMGGKVVVVSGFGPWYRYWVRFENGVLLGSLDREMLHAPSVDDVEDKSVSWLYR